MKRKTSTLLFIIGGSLMTLISLILVITGGSMEAVHAAPQACVPGPHSGTVTVDQAWCLADNPHQLSADVTVDPSVTLIIEPGVIVKGGSNIELKVQGHLEAVGNASRPITFTSVTDSGGGEWAGLLFDGGTGHLSHATIRYGGGGANSAGIYSNITAQNMPTGDVILESCQVNDSQNAFYTEYGLYINNGRATINDTFFSGNGNGGAAAPLYIVGASSVVTMTENSFIGNSRDRVLLAPGAMMGHDAILTPQAAPYELENDFTVPPTATLILQPGVTIVGGNEVELKVQGDLQALGTATQPITFTSVTDSGGGQWAGLVFDGGSGHLRHAVLRYGAGGATSAGTYSNIAIQNTLAEEVYLENCQVQESLNAFYTEYGLYINNGRATINNTTFKGIGNGGAAAPLYITGPNSAVTMTDNNFESNLPRDRIVLAESALTGSDTPLTPQTVPYELETDFTVPPTSTLTIEPGVTLKGAGNVDLIIQGDLQALGTSEQPITFTSVADTEGQWSGLVFNGGTGHLRHASVRYGGNSNSVGVHSNITVQNTPAGDVYLESCQVLDSSDWFADYGLHVTNGRVSVKDTTIGGSNYLLYVTGDSNVMVDGASIEGATHHGVLVEGDDAWLRIINSSILSNGAFSEDGVRNTGEATVILSGDPEEGNFIAYNQVYGANQTGVTGEIFATHNYWGDPSGPTHPGNPGGTGEPVSDRVLYEPWLTEVPTETLSAENLVQAVGPRYISPGETVNLGVILHNVLTETLTNAVIAAQLPDEVEYIMSTGGGQYWPQRHQVVWQLGDVAPGVAHQYGIQVRFEWGLPPHHLMDYAVLGAAENHPNAWMTLAEYQSYTELSIVSHQPVSNAELDAFLTTDPEFTTLFHGAEADGFVYYGGAQMEQLSNGTSRLALVMIDTSKPGELIDIYHDPTDTVAVHTTPMFEEIYNTTGGFRFYFETGEVTSWGEMDSGLLAQFPLLTPPCAINGCDDFGYNDCLRNCMIKKIPPGQFEGHYSSACAKCYSSGEQCQQCANHMYGYRSDSIHDILAICYDRCDLDENDDFINTKCDGNESAQHCINSHEFIVTPCVDCEYDTSQNDWGACGAGQRCFNGNCVDPDDPDIDRRNIEGVVAHDPNALYGPQAITPGQTIEYTVEWENEGAGTAYGVFVESKLAPELDESSLQIGGNGVYFSGSRTILWDIGELGPGSGDSVTFTVQVPGSAVSGTVIVAGAIVHFPSVPETTPTNEVVSIVGDVVGHSQLLETEEGTAVNIVLSGNSPSGQPLNYEIGQEPLNGTLTGAPPNLTYTPTDNFEGEDWFTFIANDGTNSSLPAFVTIIVTTGAESTAPEVFVTSPQDGEMDVTAYANPMYDNIYAPSIWAIFSEPIDESTLVTDTFFIKDSHGQNVVSTITYDGTSNKALLILNGPLSFDETYTATLTTGIRDTSDNSLSANYVWQFTTSMGDYKVFLPTIIR